uniref:Uncharacterized protein n=3 Tax=Pseudomonas aeruginosa TaxID=287 RepID=A0A7S6K736_PSEAI|nr:hypothetical protein [Pseudomonas aeruginosa]
MTAVDRSAAPRGDASLEPRQEISDHLLVNLAQAADNAATLLKVIQEWQEVSGELLKYPLQGDSHQLMPQRPHGIPYMHHQVIAITPAPWIEIEADFTMVLTADGEAP